MVLKLKSFILLGILAFGPLIVPLGGDPLALQTDDFQAVGDLSWSLGSQAGYETQAIPDGVVSHSASVDLKELLHLSLGSAWGGYPQTKSLRFFQLQGLVAVPVLQTRDLRLQVYGKGFFSPGKEVAQDYSGAMQEVTTVLSPRADGSSGGGGGVFVDSLLPIPGLSLASSVEALYGLQTPSGLHVKSGWRVLADVIPTYKLPFFNAVTLQLQNRAALWFNRGFGYEVLPQVSWSINPEWTVAAGAGVQLVGAPGWRVLAGFRWSPEIDLVKTVQSITASLDAVYTSFQVIPEGKNIRIRVYFTFEGDKAELFAPKNAKYGAKNQELVTQLLAVIQKYPDAKIVVEGHTNRSKFDVPYEQEQKAEMLPLAKARANAVADALVAAKIDKKNLKTVAIGGDRPLAPFNDAANNWKNRRVEILLIRE